MTGKRKDAGCPITLVPDICYRGTVGHDRERLSFCHARSSTCHARSSTCHSRLPTCHARKFLAGIQGLFLSAPWWSLRSRFGLLRLPLAPLTPALSRKGRGRRTKGEGARAVGPRLTRPPHGSGPASCPPPRHAGLLCQSRQKPTLFGQYSQAESERAGDRYERSWGVIPKSSIHR